MFNKKPIDKIKKSYYAYHKIRIFCLVLEWVAVILALFSSNIYKTIILSIITFFFMSLAIAYNYEAKHKQLILEIREAEY